MTIRVALTGLVVLACGVDPGAREPDAPQRCAREDVSCLTGGYAHFVISNVQGSGLPHEAAYETTDELVRDAVTGLVWERRGRSERTSWVEAKSRCAALELGRRDDFRLPARVELVTILDFGELPVVARVFEDTAPDYHWTSSPPSFVEGAAYSVYFGAGETTIADASPGSAVFRCVAGEVNAVEGAQFELEQQHVTDRATGLVWERTSPAPASWGAARRRCLERGSRLPSIRELQSIVDERRHSPAIDREAFPDAEPADYWSDTLRGGVPWTVDFSDGKTYADRDEQELLASRCVD